MIPPPRALLPLLALLLALPARADGERQKAFVMAPTGDLDERARAALTDVVAHELEAQSGLEVLSTRDTERLLALEENRQALGCDEESCLDELAGALGAELVVFSEVSRLGETYLWRLSLFDAGAARALARAELKVASRDQLLSRATPAVQELVDRYFAARRLAGTSGAERRAVLEERYQKERVVYREPSFLELDGLLVQHPVPMVGSPGAPLLGPKFYRHVGREDLAEKYEEIRSRFLWLQLGGGCGGLAVMGLAGVTTVGLLAASFAVPPLLLGAAVVGGGLFAVGASLGLTSLLLPTLFSPHPVTAAEMRQLGEEHNRRLRRSLGLDDERARTRSRSLTPLALASEAVDVE